ncbi:MAG: cupin domain-containing protein [Aureispira sp.]
MFHKKLEQAPEFVAGDHTRLRELMHPTQDNVAIGYSLAHASVASGNASLPHRLIGSESYYILQGQGRMHIEATTFEVQKGSVFLVPPNALQHIENTGTEDLVFLCIVEPYWQESEEEIV